MELAARGLVKQYPGVTALDGVDLELRSGELHAIAGENGAGKSSLVKILSGAATPDAGIISIDGTPVRFRSPRDAHAAGIRIIHQELSLVAELTVAENIFLGREPSRAGVVRQRELRANTRAVLDRVGQDAVDPDILAGTLSLAAQQMVEIAKALVHDARVLILDEPTAILAQHESDALFALIRQLRSQGVAIAYITHRMDEIFALADWITVLRDGRLVSSGPIAEYTRSDLVRQMVGRPLEATFPRRSHEPGNDVLVVEHLRAPGVRDASFRVRAGEIVGIVGLVGSGRTELLRALCGAAPILAGTVHLDGTDYHPHTPREAIARGIALVPEDRKGQGLVLDRDVRDNASMATLGAFARGGVLDRARERDAVQHWVEALRIRTPSIDQSVRLLSGGNQQKVVLARWMMARSRVLLVDEPTRGIDVGARAEIYALLNEVVAGGAAVVMVSSDLSEAIGLSDRVVVMREGRTIAVLDHPAGHAERIASLILGEAVAA